MTETSNNDLTKEYRMKDTGLAWLGLAWLGLAWLGLAACDNRLSYITIKYCVT